MIIVRETTDWKDKTPNHIYFLSDKKDKMHAYIKEGTLEKTVMKKPIGFDTRYRTFEVLEKIDE